VLIRPLHPLEMRQDALLLAHTLFCLQHGDLVVTGVRLDPSSILRSSLRQDLRRNWILTVQLGEKMNDMFGTGPVVAAMGMWESRSKRADCAKPFYPSTPNCKTL
jgi:hypothetical protein